MRSSKSRSRSKSNRPRPLGNIINRVFDSSGPEGKVRGTPQQIIEKYQVLARDAQLSNDRVAAEAFLQHAEHYTRMLAEAQREMAAEQEARQQQHNHHHNQRRDDNQRREREERVEERAAESTPEPAPEPEAQPVADIPVAALEEPAAEKPRRARAPRAPKADGDAPRRTNTRRPRKADAESGPREAVE